VFIFLLLLKLFLGFNTYYGILTSHAFKFLLLSSRLILFILFQFELKELKRRQDEEEQRRQEQLAAKTPVVSSPDEAASDRYFTFKTSMFAQRS